MIPLCDELIHVSTTNLASAPYYSPMDVEENEVVKLVYILSSGRSGSTILEMMLANSTDLWATGEVHLLNYALSDSDVKCGCGKAVVDCSFWSEVVKKLKNNQKFSFSQLSLLRDVSGLGKVVRWKYVWPIITGKVSESFLSAAQEYGEHNRTLFMEAASSINDVGSRAYFIDSSKDPYRLLLLEKSGYFDIKVIHITKPIEAFLYSMLDGKSKLLLTIRMTVRWITDGLIMTRLAKQHFATKNYMHVKYTDLVENPDEYVRDLQKLFNLPEFAASDNDSRSPISHGLAGNKVRLTNMTITPDYRWMNSPSTLLLKFSKIISYPVRRKLGYR